MDTCPACNVHSELYLHLSVLDYRSRRLCMDCIDAGCEPQPVVIAALKDGWRHRPPEIRRAVRVHIDGRYLTPAQWSERVRKRRDAVRAEIDNEDEAILKEILDISGKIYDEPPEEPRGWWFSLVNWRAA